MKNILIKIVIISLSTINTIFSQNNNIALDSIQIKKFKSYVDSILSFEKDSIFYISEFDKYKAKYHTICYNYEIGNTTLKFDSTNYLCLENISEIADTTLYNILRNNDNKNNYLDINNVLLNKKLMNYLSFKAKSYNKSNFILLEKTYYLNIGNYTSQKASETFYMVKVE